MSMCMQVAAWALQSATTLTNRDIIVGNTGHHWMPWTKLYKQVRLLGSWLGLRSGLGLWWGKLY